jgi:hypothetical protein
MSGPVHDIAFDGTTYVRVGLNGVIQTSLDGLSWTTQTSGVVVALWGAAYGNGYFVVCGASGTMLRSPDGVTWTDVSSGMQAALQAEDLYSVAYADVFLTCGTNGVVGIGGINADVFMNVSSGTTFDLWDIDGGGGTWVAVGDSSTIVTGPLISEDLSPTVTEDLSLGETPTGAGSAFVASATDGVMFRNRPHWANLTGPSSSATENMQYWRVAPDVAYMTENEAYDGSSYSATVSEDINFLEHLYWNPSYVRENLTFADTIPVIGWPKVITDAIGLDDTTTRKITAYTTITDGLSFAETLLATGQFGVAISDGLGIGDTPAGTMVLNAAVSESFAFQALITVGGTETQDAEVWTTWVLNTKNFAVSEYDRYDFHSFAKYNDTYYGAKDDGIYLLSGDYDDGWLIKAAIKTGILDFKSDFQKKLPRVYLGIRNDDTMVMKTITNEGVERWYEMKDNQDGVAKSRVKVTQGVESGYWQFELVNVTGDDFDVSDIQLMPILTSRRIK